MQARSAAISAELKQLDDEEKEFYENKIEFSKKRISEIAEEKKQLTADIAGAEESLKNFQPYTTLKVDGI